MKKKKKVFQIQKPVLACPLTSGRKVNKDYLNHKWVSWFEMVHTLTSTQKLNLNTYFVS